MASEIPVVASRVGGIVEVVDDGVTGYLARVGDIQAMAQSAVKILSNQGLQQKMGKAALQRIQDKFHIDIISKQYEDLYEKVYSQPDLHCPEMPAFI
jgi:glycosyltransferase involved in cell wall biosynthesis